MAVTGSTSAEMYVAVTGCTWQPSSYTAKTVVLTGVRRGPHQAFYTGVKFAVLVQHPVVLF